jgi:phosphoribosylformylglycinamidine (FGAM) synthase-like enzyme
MEVQMAIATNKRRYALTLTPARVQRFQELCKRLNLPPSTMSSALDDVLDSLSDTFQLAADKGADCITDIVSMAGKQMDSLNEEKRKHEDEKKRNPGAR